KYPGRMSPLIALDFILPAVSLLCMDMRSERAQRLSQFLCLPVFLVALSSSISLTYRLFYFSGVFPPISMAIHAAFSMILLSAGIFNTRPDRGWPAIFFNDTEGAVIAQRLVIAAVLMPPTLGWLMIMGLKTGVYGAVFGVSLFVVSIIFILLLMIWHNADR